MQHIVMFERFDFTQSPPPRQEKSVIVNFPPITNENINEFEELIWAELFKDKDAGPTGHFSSWSQVATKSVDPINELLNAVKWQPLENADAFASTTLHATHSGILNVGGFEFHGYILSDGRRVIDADDLHRFLGLSEVDAARIAAKEQAK